MQPKTRTRPAQFAETDNLRYRYTPPTGEPASNRLQRVDDLAPAPTAFGARLPERPDFNDGPTSNRTTPDYSYDGAGSLTSDANKRITRISYNHLRLPESVVWATGDSLRFRYTATGQKVAKLAYAVGQPVVCTDYLGPWQYEADSLRWLSTSEGRALRQLRRDPASQPTVRYAYEYTLKDHVGNLRVAFRAGERYSYYAGLEDNAHELRREQQQFDSASVSPPVRRYVTPQCARTGDGAAQLNAGGGAPVPFGPIKQLAVGRGDTLLVTAHGMYPEAACHPHWALSLAGFVAGLVQQQPVGPPPTDGRQRVRVLPLLNVGLPLAAAVPQLAGGVPQAYLRVLVFNEDSALVDTHTRQLTQAALGNYESLSLTVIVPQAGYATAYVATESEADVFFDDITVEHRQGLLIQENHYDPYGLELAGLSQSSPGLKALNQYTWNGKELQADFGWRMHDHGWRFYDPQLGRWAVVDPDAEEAEQEGWTTYQFGLNNAVRYNDLDGRKPGPGDEISVAGILYNMAQGLAVSAINTAVLVSGGPILRMVAGGDVRASVGKSGDIEVGVRSQPTTLLGLVANVGSDLLDAANVGATIASGGSSSSLGAGILVAKTASKTVITNSIAQAGKQAINSPKVQKIADQLKKFDKEGKLTRNKPNTRGTAQESNISLRGDAGESLNIRLETHDVPIKLGGKGPGKLVRHINVEPMTPAGNLRTKALPNQGHLFPTN